MTDPIITWLNGFSALLLICFAWFIFLLSLYYYKKYKTRVWITGMILAVAVALGWTGITITFLSVAINGYNLPGVKSIISYFSYSTVPLGALAIIYSAWDVSGSPKNKKYVLLGYGIYSIVYYIVLYTTFNQAVVCPEVPAGEIYDDWITPFSIFYYVLWGQVFLTSVIAFIGFNKLRESTAGVLKRKSLMVVLSAPIIGGCILLDTVIMMEWAVNFLFIPRVGMILGVSLLILGFKPSK